MITPVDTVSILLGAGFMGWLMGAALYSFRRFVWKALN